MLKIAVGVYTNNDIYYIDSFFEKSNNLYDKIFFKYEITDIDKDKKYLNINKKYIDEKVLKKMLKKCKIEDAQFVYSNNIKLSQNLKENKYTGKIILRNMIIPLLEHFENNLNIDFRLENIFLTVDNDKNKDIIVDLGNKCKSISLVTDNIRKLYRLDSKLNKDDNIIVSVSSNRRKALQRAKIVVNFDYDETFFENFNINRNCIIINLSNNVLTLKNSFQGSIIEKLEIDYINKYENFINIDNFDKTILYETFIYDENYDNAKEIMRFDNCRIKKVLGMRNEINFIKSRN